MRDALTKDSRIHRDISVGNVILVKEPGRAVRRGYLIDWETSCEVDDAGAATEMGRVVRYVYLYLRCAPPYLTHSTGNLAICVHPDAGQTKCPNWQGDIPG